MEFAAFCDRASEIEAEPADLEIIDLVADLLVTADTDLRVVARFVQGRVFPGWRSITLDIGPTLCYEAIARSAGQNVTTEEVEARLADLGEIGEVAASFDLGSQRGLASFGGGEGPLTVGEVATELDRLAAATGAGSQSRKLDILFGLFNRCTPEEARFLARLVLSEMRIGVGGGTVRDAIAQAFDVSIDDVARALQVSNDYGLVAETAREAGASGLAAITLTVGRPVQSMLAQAGTVADGLEAWALVGVQWKYDGARIQAHVDEDVRLFSRNMEEVTDPLPEIVEFLDVHVDGPAILDGEVVAVDDDGDPLPFQEVLRRFRRKHDVAAAREDVALEPYFFDCLHLDGEDLIDRPLRARFDRLETVLSEGVSPLTITNDREEIDRVEERAIAAGHEGIMLKNPAAAYTPGRRGKNWLKVKPDVETLDLVVTGAEWGEGRRASFLGTFELSVLSDGSFAQVGNVATGVTDEELADLTERLEPHIVAQDGQQVTIEPAVVFEVGYEEIQSSPTYDSGYALRFPRFVGVREDLSPAGADTLERVERLAGV